MSITRIAFILTMGLWGAVFVSRGAASPPESRIPEMPPAIEAAAPADSPQQAPATPPKGYIGAEACATCHEGYDKTVDATKHGFKANERTPMAKMGCESCHGPGEAHANDPEKVKPIQFDKVAAHVANGQCQTCHNREIGRAHV